MSGLKGCDYGGEVLDCWGTSLEAAYISATARAVRPSEGRAIKELTRAMSIEAEETGGVTFRSSGCWIRKQKLLLR